MLTKSVLALTILGALSLAAEAAELSTTTYLLPQTTVAIVGGRLVTASYIVDTSAGQESVVGVSTTASYILESGFFNSKSTDPVPVELLSFEVVDGDLSAFPGGMSTKLEPEGGRP